MPTQKYTGIKSALKKAKIILPKITNILEIGCLHSVYNNDLRKQFETANNTKRTVHVVGCDLPSLKHIKKSKGSIKAWQDTHKHTEVLSINHKNIKNIHKKTTKKHLGKKNQYHLIFSIRPDLKNQKKWLEAYADAWNHHKKEGGDFLLYIAKNRGEAQKRKQFIEKVKKKLGSTATSSKGTIPLSDAEIIIFK